MAANDARREGVRIASRLASAVVAMPVQAGYAVLGAVVVMGRELVRLVSSVLPLGADRPTPRHHKRRVRESAEAAERAARASGLLSRRDR